MLAIINNKKYARKEKLSLLFFIFLLIWSFNCFAEEESTLKPELEPIIVNGDTVEYSTESKEFTASGNVSVIYKKIRLVCDDLKLNSQTKDCEASGNVRLEEPRGTIKGSKIIYNFDKGTGTILDTEFMSNPYFSKSKRLEKVSDSEFEIYRGYMTTCSLDNPHYRIKFRRVNFFPGDKVQIKDATIYAGKVPALYLPQYNHSLKDSIMKVQLMAGSDKHWGQYLLSAWRYSLTEDIKGRIFLDYRSNYGIAEGLGLNYYTDYFGKGDFKFYYTQERNKSKKEVNIDDVNSAKVFQRYLVRLRHKWDIDEKTNVLAEYWKIVDSKMIVLDSKYNLLKDYFPREYDKDQRPLSYVSIHKSFDYSNLDILVQKRVNRWYPQEEKLPEIKYSLPSFRIGNSPFYFQNDTSYVNFAYRYAAPSASWDDIFYNKFDTLNKISMAQKLAFVQLTPFVSGQWIYQTQSTYGVTSTLVYTMGAEASTKFYRIFNVKTNFLGLDINALRHIITPTVKYTYSNSAERPAGDARFGGQGANTNGLIEMELSNKLQTKRKGGSVDLLDFRINTSYNFKPKLTDERGSYLSDVLFDLELYPYSWMRLKAEATYKRSGSHSDINYNKFSNYNYEIGFDFGNERSFNITQRYERKGGSEIVYDFTWRINPKWKAFFYHRFNSGNELVSSRGLVEQEYTITRDLHCWEVDLSYNITRSRGESVWMIFRLKAFPELEFDFNKSYNAPKPGTQGYNR